MATSDVVGYTIGTHRNPNPNVYLADVIKTTEPCLINVERRAMFSHKFTLQTGTWWRYVVFEACYYCKLFKELAVDPPKYKHHQSTEKNK